MKIINFYKFPSVRLYSLSFRELWRNRFGLFLLLIIPGVFLAVVEWTSGTGKLPVDLYFPDETKTLLLSQHDINLVFIGTAVSGFLTAYYAILLFNRNFKYFRHCIGMGLSPTGFILARFLFFITVTIILSVYISLSMEWLVTVEHPVRLFIGILSVGMIYGAFGGIVGLISKDIMVAILWVVLLANLDAGWLQNPVFYSSAQKTELIHWLPAFYPTQVVFAAAFTSDWNTRALWLSMLYATVFIVLMLLIIHLKIRSVKKWWLT